MHISINGIGIHYEFAGKGKPVLLLHGWGGRIEGVQPIIKSLSRGFNVYAIDLPGFGASDPPPEPWGVDNYVGILVDFLNRLNLERVSIIGHSFGGRIAIMLAAKYPERIDKLILIDSAGIRIKGIKYYFRTLIAQAGKLLVRLLGEKGEGAKRALYRYAGSGDYRSAGKMRGTFIKVVNEDLRYLLPNIRATTLIIWGEEDTETPLKQGKLIASAIKGSTLVVLKGAGHYSYIDRFQQFHFTVSDFLTR